MQSQKKSKSKTIIQDNVYQTLQKKDHSLSPDFQVLTLEDLTQNKQEIKQSISNDNITRKSLYVSMIEDDDIISDYFLANQKTINNNLSQNQSIEKPIGIQEINPHSKKIDPHTETNKPYRQSIQSPAKKEFHFQNHKIAHDSIQQSTLIEPNQLQRPENYKSRLLLQKQKYNLHFDEVYGEIFIYIAECELIGYNKVEYGYFLLTNYRVIFFKFIPELDQTKKRVDLPFGFAKTIDYLPKKKQVIFYLHYDHYWKFYFENKDDFDKIKIMLQLYAKTKDIKSFFAFSYALRVPQFQKFNFDILKEYLRMRLTDVSLIFPNEGFKLSQTYPQYICIPQQISQGSREVIKSICQNFKNNRLPILTFKYGNGQDWAGLWLSGTYVQDKKLNEKQLKTYFSYILGSNKKRKMYVYDCYFKQSKVLLQSSLDNKIQNHWLGLATNSQIKSSYDLIVQAYLVSKNSFFTDVLASKWYDIVLSLLKSSFQIADKLMGRQPVLIKQDQMKEKSLIVSALTQLILQPFYRTFKGFKYLVMKQFICFGYKFSSRLGNKLPQNACPTFILFLDSVSQLIQMNPLYFEFNYKYLSKIANLIYTNIFGTFLADSPKQFFQSQILQITVQIWSQLESQLTQNAFYDIKNGILTNNSHNINDLRFWVQHFGFIASQPKDAYKTHPLAQSTADYIPLQCLKLKNENVKLKSQVQRQRHEITKLKQMIAVKKAKKQQNS